MQDLSAMFLKIGEVLEDYKQGVLTADLALTEIEAILYDKPSVIEERKKSEEEDRKALERYLSENLSKIVNIKGTMYKVLSGDSKKCMINLLNQVTKQIVSMHINSILR